MLPRDSSKRPLPVPSPLPTLAFSACGHGPQGALWTSPPASCQDYRLLPRHTPRPSAHGQGTDGGLPARPLTPAVFSPERKAGGALSVLSANKHFWTLAGSRYEPGLGVGMGGDRENTGVWWLRRGLCYVLAELHAQLIVMMKGRRKDNFLLSASNMPCYQLLKKHPLLTSMLPLAI